MRRLILAVVLGLTPFAWAQQPGPSSRSWEMPEVPDRFSLPRNTARNGAAGSKDTSFAQLRKILLSSAPDAQKADAAILWNEKLNQSASTVAYWKTADDSLTLLDALFQEAPSQSRRYAIFEIFAALGASIRDHIVLHPRDEAWRPHWKRLGEIKRRGLADKDQKLSEFFQRYVPFPNLPQWRAMKDNVRKAEERLAEARTADTADIRKIWQLSESIEAAQKTVIDRMAEDLRKMKLTDKQLKSLQQHLDHIYAYRMYTNWTNMHIRVIQERFGTDEAAKAGLAVEPVKLGWPSYY